MSLVGFAGIGRRVTFLGTGEDVGNRIELFFAAQIGQQLQSLVERFAGRPSGRSTLLTTTIGRTPACNAFSKHKPRLRHRTFGRVDQQQAAVGHLHDTLDFAAEVSVPRSVDQVDLHTAIRDRDVLGQNRDPTLTLQVVRIQDPLATELGIAKLAALTKHAVDQRGLSMVDVGDDDDVSDIAHVE